MPRGMGCALVVVPTSQGRWRDGSERRAGEERRRRLLRCLRWNKAGWLVQALHLDEKKQAGLCLSLSQAKNISCVAVCGLLWHFYPSR